MTEDEKKERLLTLALLAHEFQTLKMLVEILRVVEDSLYDSITAPTGLDILGIVSLSPLRCPRCTFYPPN